MVEEEVRPVAPVVVPIGRHGDIVMVRREAPELPTLAAILTHTWFLVQVPSGRELLVADLMRSRGHEAIVPMVRCYRRANGRAKRKAMRSFPLMARYLILGLDPDGLAGFDDLRRFSFIHDVVCDARGYKPIVKTQLIKFVKLLGSATWTVDAAQRFMRTGREFGVGDQVEVLEGSLAGWTVTVKAIDRDTAYFDCVLFNRLTTFHLPLEVLGKLG